MDKVCYTSRKKCLLTYQPFTELWNTKTHTLYHTVAEHVFILDEMLRSYLHETESNEIVVVINFDGWTVRQASQATPRAVMLNLDFVLVRNCTWRK